MISFKIKQKDWVTLSCLVLIILSVSGYTQDKKTISYTKHGKSVIGVALLPPLLLSSTESHLWVSAAIEERFYEAGHFARQIFVPDPAQLNELLNNCPYKSSLDCKYLVMGNLKLSALIDMKFKMRKGEYLGTIIFNFLLEGKSDTLEIKSPLNKPEVFIKKTVLKIFKYFHDDNKKLKREVSDIPLKKLTAYGCYALGYRYVIRRQFKEAFYPLMRSLELDPGSVRPQYQIALSYKLTGRPDSALILISQIPDEKMTWNCFLLKAELNLLLGKTVEAFKNLKAASKIQPEKIAALEYGYGNYYKNIKASTRGIGHVISALNKNPSVLEYYLTLAELYAINGEYNAALPYYERLIEFAPQNKIYQLNYGIALRESNHIGWAIDIFKLLIQSHPAFYPARINLGITYYKLGWKEKAKNLFQSNIDLHLDSLDSYTNLALITVLNENDYKKGRVLLKRVLKMQPNSPETLLNLGLLELKTKNYKDSEKYLLTALKYNQTDTAILLSLAEIYMVQENVRKEFELLNKIIEFNPDNISALTRLANHSIRTNENVEAINYLMEIIDQQPEAYRQRFLLASCLFTEGDKNAGMEQLIYVADNFTNSPEIQIELADKYFENGLYKNAIDKSEQLLGFKRLKFKCYLILGKSFLQQINKGRTRRINAKLLAEENLFNALALNPKDWKVQYWLGKLHRSVKRNYKKARKHYKKAMALAPSQKEKITIEKELATLF